jgi:putative oxidoreductase
LRREPGSSATPAGRSALGECVRARRRLGSVAGGGEEEVKKTSNVQRPTSNVELGEDISSSFIPHRSSFRGIACRIAPILLGALFIYAGAVKLLDPVRFAGDIENYHLLPWPVGVRLAFYLPWLEILCGLALIFRRLYSGALVLVFALMLVFIGATISAKVRGLDISCGCFGHVSDQLSFAWHLVLDFAILAGIGALLFLSFAQRKTFAIAESKSP